MEKKTRKKIQTLFKTPVKKAKTGKEYSKYSMTMEKDSMIEGDWRNKDKLKSKLDPKDKSVINITNLTKQERDNQTTDGKE